MLLFVLFDQIHLSVFEKSYNYEQQMMPLKEIEWEAQKDVPWNLQCLSLSLFLSIHER